MSPTAITSTSALTSSKKRKHELLDASTSSKKVKTTTSIETEAVASPEKKKKKAKKHRKPSGEFKHVRARMTVSLPPIFTLDPTEGIEEMLDSMILRCVRDLKPHPSHRWIDS